jgi:hypothetical protein
MIELDDNSAVVKFRGVIYKIVLTEFEHRASAKDQEIIAVRGIVREQQFDYQDSTRIDL